MSSRVWFRPVSAVVPALVLVLVSVGPVAAETPSALELVRGLRENGQPELALKYLTILEGKPLPPDDPDAHIAPPLGTPLSADDRAALSLERAKCLLDAAEDESDEGTRLSMVAEAKETLNQFLVNHPKHPQRVNALLTDARLKSLGAKEQLNRARRVELPQIVEGTAEESKARAVAANKQKKEAAEARPLFDRAAKQFTEASDLLRARLADPNLDVAAQTAIRRQATEAELASAINLFSIAETYMPDEALDVADKKERAGNLDKARKQFEKLAAGPSTRTAWIAKAWMAEITYEQNEFNKASAEVDTILREGRAEAEDGKRMARFFKLRRDFLAAMGGNLDAVKKCDSDLEIWLRPFGPGRKMTPEAFAVKYYRGRINQRWAAFVIGPPPKVPPKEPPKLPADARAKFKVAEQMFREVGQTDNEYTARATRQRMNVVRQLLDNADLPAASYTTFEDAQMASLIRLGKLNAAEAVPANTPDEEKAKEEKLRQLRLAVVEILERARALATPKDSQADVTDVLLRLIYFYQLTDQPYQAAVLGEYMAHTVKTTGGKSAHAGLIAINGYTAAARRLKIDDRAALTEAQKADRARAKALALFLDDKFPNDTATDSARHQLALLLLAEGATHDAFKVTLKVRPGYASLTSVRLLEGYLAGQLIHTSSTLPAAEKTEVFRRAVADLAKVPKPLPIAPLDEVRGYLSARSRLATLLLTQPRVDPAAEQTNPGFTQALAIAEGAIASVPTFDCMVEPGGMKKLNVDGMEMSLYAHDAHGRAVYLRAMTLINAGKLDEAGAALKPTLDLVRRDGALFTDQMKAWADGGGSGEPEAVQKANVARVAALVDKTRVDVILAGFRMFARQGKGPEAAALLDLLEKAGGKISENLPVLESMGREMAAHLVQLRRDPAKDADAKNLSAGLGVLLERISKVENLRATTQLFIGQTLVAVQKYDQAITVLKLVPPPAFPEWEKKKVEDFPEKDRGQVIAQTRDYAMAQLYIARALREQTPPKLADAETMLKALIGTPDKQAWGYGRLYFRKELAQVLEAKAKGSKSRDLWAPAVNEWGGLAAVARGRIQNMPKDITDEQKVERRNDYADAFLDYHRCILRANKELQTPAGFQTSCTDIAKKFVDVETEAAKHLKPGEFKPEVRNRYYELLQEPDMAPVLAAYKAAGGTLFLAKAPLQ